MTALASRFHDGRRWKVPLVLMSVTCVVVLGCGRTGEQPPAGAKAGRGGKVEGKVEAKREPSSQQATQEPQPPAGDESASSQRPSADGKALYARHCAGCHGQRGNGRGVAAAFLFPKPRDFRRGRFRLVSTSNSVPSREDLDAVLRRGMPGSAMVPWPQFSDDERSAIIDHVLQLFRDGLREQYVQSLIEQEGLTEAEIADDEAIQEEIEEFVRARATPGPASEVPAVGAPDAAAIARGREIYLRQGCQSCHGTEGRGDGVKQQFDEEGYPTRPRDFTRGIFKGSHDPASLYRRIAYGMPGTPMPGSRQLKPAEIVDLVHFIRSLSTEEARNAAVLRREQIVVRRVEQLPGEPDDARWSDVPVTTVRLTPLWWRDTFNPQRDVVQLQAVHDGQWIVLRLSWPDETADQAAVTTQAFRDGVAVELYRSADGDPSAGLHEPFIGMGQTDEPVDVWFWDADRQAAADPFAVVYPRTVVDRYPFSETAVASPELDRPGARPADQPPISLPAVAAANLIVPGDGSGASSLVAGGPGTATFRLPQSQVVEARGKWSSGRWTVVMRRKLAVGPEDGVSLQPGRPASLAIAVWDGAQRDRDGQKLISIWQELRIE